MLRYLENVVTLRLDARACNGCGMCAVVCPRGVFEIEDQPFFGLLRKAVIADQDACIECGACAINCPVNAIRVQAGVGCATGVLLSAIGKGGECCSSVCGVSPADTGSTQAGCCGPRTEDTRATGGKVNMSQIEKHLINMGVKKK